LIDLPNQVIGPSLLIQFIAHPAAKAEHNNFPVLVAHVAYIIMPNDVIEIEIVNSRRRIVSAAPSGFNGVDWSS
jgi:hypothetical protein